MKRFDKKYLVVLVATLLLACLAAGCGSKKSETVSMYDLSKVMIEADADFPDMITVSTSDSDAKDNFVYLSDFDYTKVESYFLSYSSEGKADEVAVIAVKDVADVEKAKKSLESHVETRRNVYDTYDPTQLSRVENAVVFSHNQYAVLIISDNTSEVKNAFMEMLKAAE